MLFAGKDATEEFDMLHDRKVIKKYGIDQDNLQRLTVRLTDDHRPGDPAEATRIVAAGGSVRRCQPGKQALQVGQCLEPPRL